MKSLSIEEIEDILKEKVAEKTQIPIQKIDNEQEFFELGLDSLSSVVLIGDIEDLLGISIESTSVWDNSNIRKLALHIRNILEEQKNY